VREKYCWLVVDKPSEQGEHIKLAKLSLMKSAKRTALDGSLTSG
jgi:hypothetical protein